MFLWLAKATIVASIKCQQPVLRGSSTKPISKNGPMLASFFLYPFLNHYFKLKKMWLDLHSLQRNTRKLKYIKQGYKADTWYKPTPTNKIYTCMMIINPLLFTSWQPATLPCPMLPWILIKFLLRGVSPDVRPPLPPSLTCPSTCHSGHRPLGNFGRLSPIHFLYNFGRLEPSGRWP